MLRNLCMVLLAAVFMLGVVGGTAVAAESVPVDDQQVTEMVSEESETKVVAEKTYNGGKVLAGKGAFRAHGKGFMHVRGNGAFEVKGNGILAIKDVAGDAKIVVTGHGESKQLGEWTFYYGFDGHAQVEGSHVRIAISGYDLHTQGRGAGIVKLLGEGKCRTWSAPRQLDSDIEPAEVDPVESLISLDVI